MCNNCQELETISYDRVNTAIVQGTKEAIAKLAAPMVLDRSVVSTITATNAKLLLDLTEAKIALTSFG